ncbi:hypothetical protein BU16DRAFT_84427 [Lophium mytilinum]|uniref:Uncharacterized protein n=1 Tax=Lophium mytilinum TaxID=390894 RepID=A0A6A6QRV0_9PEZI|nr:hypothetical protein BU16DRAFT_84427 [Lophium mytilinum]
MWNCRLQALKGVRCKAKLTRARRQAIGEGSSCVISPASFSHITAPYPCRLHGGGQLSLRQTAQILLLGALSKFNWSRISSRVGGGTAMMPILTRTRLRKGAKAGVLASLAAYSGSPHGGGGSNVFDVCQEEAAATNGLHRRVLAAGISEMRRVWWARGWLAAPTTSEVLFLVSPEVCGQSTGKGQLCSRGPEVSSPCRFWYGRCERCDSSSSARMKAERTPPVAPPGRNQRVARRPRSSVGLRRRTGWFG